MSANANRSLWCRRSAAYCAAWWLVTLMCCLECCCAAQTALTAVSTVGKCEPFVSFVFDGAFYGETNILRLEEHGLDRTSPQALARSLFTARNKQNVELLENIYGVERTKTGYQPTPENKVVQMSVCAEMHYGALSILLLHVRLAAPGIEWIETCYFEKRTNGYFALLRKPDDSASRLLNTLFMPGPVIDFRPIGTDELAPLYTNACFTNFYSKSTSRPLIVSFPGKVFSKPIDADDPAITNDEETVSQVKVLKTLYDATRLHETNVVINCICPDELQNRTPVGVVRDYVLGHLATVPTSTNKMMIEKKIRCGDFCLFFFKIQNMKPGVLGGWVGMRYVNDRWFVSPLGPKSDYPGNYQTVVDYCGLPLTLYPNVFLHNVSAVSTKSL